MSRSNSGFRGKESRNPHKGGRGRIVEDIKHDFTARLTLKTKQLRTHHIKRHYIDLIKINGNTFIREHVWIKTSKALVEALETLEMTNKPIRIGFNGYITAYDKIDSYTKKKVEQYSIEVIRDVKVINFGITVDKIMMHD